MASEVPHFHDGWLTGVVLGEGSATVYLRQSTGEEYTLTLCGLETLKMEDFRQGNTISMVQVVCGPSPYKHAGLERLFDPPHPSAAIQHHEAHAALIRRQSARIASGEASLLVIVPSYGADLLSICREVTVAKRGGKSPLGAWLPEFPPIGRGESGLAGRAPLAMVRQYLL